MGEILPVLLQQQQAILRPAFDAVLSSSSAADADGDVGDNDDADTAMRYGCRNCETLQRQLEQSEADRVLLTAELDRLKEVPPSMSDSVSSSSGSGSSESCLPSICAVPKGMTENEEKRHHSPRVDARKTLHSLFVESEVTSSPFQSHSPSSAAPSIYPVRFAATPASESFVDAGVDSDDMKQQPVVHHDDRAPHVAVSRSRSQQHLQIHTDHAVESTKTIPHSTRKKRRTELDQLWDEVPES